MNDSTTPPSPDEPGADETFTWKEPDTRGTGGPAGAATSILDSVRDAVDDLAERAAPSVREFSARAAEIAAIAADKAAPLAKRAGEVTADASGKLATKSRSWAADLRASITTGEHPATPDVAPPPPTSGFEPAEGAREPEEPSSQN
jgi:hypothetical protein